MTSICLPVGHSPAQIAAPVFRRLARPFATVCARELTFSDSRAVSDDDRHDGCRPGTVSFTVSPIFSLYACSAADVGLLQRELQGAVTVPTIDQLPPSRCSSWSWAN